MKSLRKIFMHLLFSCLAFFTFFPFIYLLLLSLQTDVDIAKVPPAFFPSHLLFENYIRVLSRFPLLDQLLNTVIYASTTTLMVVLTASLAAYALAKLNLPGRTLLTIFFVSSLLLPPNIRAIPMYTLIARLGWADTWKGMILPLSCTGFAIFFLYQYMITIPQNLIDAARIDGASEGTILIRIITPLAKTAIGTIGLYNFLFRWRDYIWPLIVTRGKVTTLAVGIGALQTTEYLILWNLVAAGTMFLFIPSLLLFLGLRRYIMNAVAIELK